MSNLSCFTPSPRTGHHARNLAPAQVEFCERQGVRHVEALAA